ncbi:MAG TPA: hypothetical protein VEH49_08775, partial [Methylomirabilota bacterium]|nr:hypothetical protein [Methylomirabilota bacterium]
MKLTILDDAATTPTLFCWAGPIEPSVLDSWLKERAWVVPEDLKYLWSQTGGGDFFESETIFAPSSSLWADDSLDEVNRHQRNKGLPNRYVAFHSGLRFSAVDMTKGRYFFLDEDSFQVQQEFPALEKWYVEGVRPDFADRYSLTK